MRACEAVWCASARARPRAMVLPMLELPAALQWNFAWQLSDTTTRRLARPRTGESGLQGAAAGTTRRAEGAAPPCSRASSPSSSRSEARFDPIMLRTARRGRHRLPLYHQTWGTTPCRSTLKVPYERVKLPLMLRHLQTVHPTEYGIMSSCLSCSTIDDGVPCPVRLMTTKWSSSGHMWQSQRNGPTGAAHRCPIV